MVQGIDPHVREKRKPGFFGRLLSGIGRVLGAVAAPLSFIFPSAAIAAAGMYGIGKIGDQMQISAAAKQQQKQQQAMQPVAYPGMEMGAPGATPAAFDVSAQDAQVMDVLFARGDSQKAMTAGMAGGMTNI